MTMSMSTTAPSTATSNGSGASSAGPTRISTQSKPSMASDTDSTHSEEADLRLSWSGRWTLRHRILAVNVLTLVLLALSVLYLEVFQNRLSKERTRQTRVEAITTAQALTHVQPSDWPALLGSVSRTREN